MASESRSETRKGSKGGPRKRASPQQRAEALLRELLAADVYEHLMQRGYLEVRSPSHHGRTYRIPRIGGFVWVFESGEPRELLCIGPTEPLPPGDVMIMHKLLIETGEADYLRTANHLPLIMGGSPLEHQFARLVPTPW